MAYEKILAKKVNPVKAIAISFIVIILIGTALLMMPFSSREHRQTPFVDALFTSASATTVTGLVVKDTQDHYSPIGHMIILALIQIGGMGYMTLMSFLFIFGGNLKLTGGAYIHESMNLPSLGDIYQFARRTIAFVILFEAAGAALLFLIWRASMGTEAAAKYGIFHSISAFNNAGFDLFGGFNSLTGMAGNNGVNLIIITLTIVGGIGFIVMNELLGKASNARQKLSLHTRVVLAMTAILLVTGTALFFALENSNEKTLAGMPLAEKAAASLFQSATARTSGFGTINIGNASAATLLLLTFLMLIGSSPGGTGGGIKTTTAAVAFKALVSFARGKSDVELFDRRLSQTAVWKSFATIIAAAAVIALSSAAMTLLEKADYQKLLFEIASAFSTTGFTTGITPGLSTASKAILIAVMFIGRIGPLALLHLFLSPKRTRLTRLPEEDVLVG